MSACDILLLEDERDLLELFSLALGRLGCTIHKADSGQGALDVLQTLTPTLIVLDLAMPQINGLDVLHHVRADARFAETKVVILTAVPVLLNKQDASGTDLVLVKPIAPRQLEQHVRRLLEDS
jgi:CheY-like chemotaxis protein